MCDYSLQKVATRPGKIGDKLITANFQNSGTRGFAAVGEPNVAVCLLPGTELAFQKEVECEEAFGFFWRRRRFVNIEENVARFRQINIEQLHAHHDALEFPKGQIVLVTALREGQQATLLQLPVSPHAANEVADNKNMSPADVISSL